MTTRRTLVWQTVPTRPGEGQHVRAVPDGLRCPLCGEGLVMLRQVELPEVGRLAAAWTCSCLVW